MANSASGQNEPNRAMWLATRAGKMAPSCPLGTTRCMLQEKYPRKPYNKSFIDQFCLVKMADYWPCSFFGSLWISISSRSINTQKKNLANIQPSRPHTWSTIHTYFRAKWRPLTDTWIYNLCDVHATSESGQVDNLLLWKKIARQCFMRLKCYWQWISS